jgi:hypothetical protein
MKKIQLLINSIFIILIFSSIFLISCSTVPKTYSTRVTVPPDYLGIVGGNKGSVEEYNLLNEMCTTWILKTFYWSAIENEKDNFDFSSYDNYVEKAKEQGKKIIAVLAYAAPWLNDGKDNKYISGKNIEYYLNYIEALVDRYKGKVDAWQIWNEPNWIIFWRGSNKEFYELSRLAANKIREVDPDAYIIGGGFLLNPKNFIINMKNAGAMENLNALSFHPYAANPKGSIKLIDDFFKTVEKIDFHGDIWITEIGYPTSGWYPSRVSLEKMPSYVIKTIAPSAIRGARVLIWYDLLDSYKYGEYPNKIDSELYFGLVYSDLSRKSGAWAYELCARYIPGSQYNPELPLKEGIKSNVVTLCFTGNESNTNTLIIWDDKNKKQKIKVSIPSTITIHDISTGNNFSLLNEAIIEITDEPVFITWQGSSIPHLSLIGK